MSDFQVTHTRKNSNDVITHIGVKGRWETSEAVAIRDIETGTNTYFVNVPQRANVYVAPGTYRKYLKTTADTTTKNNLDSLPPL